MILTKYYYPSGVIKEKSYWSEDGLSRDNGPAVIMCDKSGVIFRSEYWVGGVLHRAGGLPAIYEFSARRECSEHWEFGQRHRDDRPAVHVRDKSGVRLHQFWNRGKLHGQPAIMIYRDGRLRAMHNYENGEPCELWQVHRGYASVHYRYWIIGKEYNEKRVGRDQAGRQIYTEFRKDGTLHKTDGPAKIVYECDGGPYRLYYYISGERRRDGPYQITQCYDGTRVEYCYADLGPHQYDRYKACYDNGKVVWAKYYRRNLLHRLDGPAVISPDGNEYYTDGSAH